MKIRLIFLIAICFSCQNENQNFETIKVTPSTKMIYASTVFSDFEILPLDGTEDAIIGEVTKFKVTETNIFILDSKQKKLIIFSNEGDFLAVIDNVGRGPNEYLTLDDFIIYKNKLLLLSTLSKKILQYSMGGVFEKYIDVKKQYLLFVEGADDTVVLFRDFVSSLKSDQYGSDFFNIETFDLKSETVVKKLSPFLEKQNGQLSFGNYRKVFESNNKSLFMTLPLQHKILKIDKKGLSTYYAIDFGDKHKLPENAAGFTFEEGQKLDAQIIWTLDNLAISNSYIYFSYLYNGQSQNAIINKNNYNVTSGYITGDYEIPFSLGNKLVLKDNKIITFINPEDLDRAFFKKEEISNLFKERGYLVEELVKNNNPIIIKYQLK